MIKYFLSLKKANEEIAKLRKERKEAFKALNDLSIRHGWTLEMQCVCESHTRADQLIVKYKKENLDHGLVKKR